MEIQFLAYLLPSVREFPDKYHIRDCSQSCAKMESSSIIVLSNDKKTDRYENQD